MYFQHNEIEAHHHHDLQDGIVKETRRLQLLYHLSNCNNNNPSLPYDQPEGIVHSMGKKELPKLLSILFLVHPQDCKLCQFPKH